MYREILQSIEGVGLFPIVSLLLFVAVFSGVLLATSRLSPSRLAELARMPLDKGDDQ